MLPLTPEEKDLLTTALHIIMDKLDDILKVLEKPSASSGYADTFKPGSSVALNARRRAEYHQGLLDYLDELKAEWGDDGQA